MRFSADSSRLVTSDSTVLADAPGMLNPTPIAGSVSDGTSLTGNNGINAQPRMDRAIKETMIEKDDM